MFLKWFLKRKLLYNYQYIHNLFFQKRTYAIAATTPYPCAQKYTFGGTHPLKCTYFMDGPISRSSTEYKISIFLTYESTSILALYDAERL